VDPFEVQGTWWVPNQKRHRKATGRVTYSPATGTMLEAYGKRLEEESSVYVPVLHGDTEDGLMTLLGCVFERSNRKAFSDHAAQFFSCEAVVRGGHVSRESLYQHATLQVKHLNEWARLGRMLPLGEARKYLRNAGIGVYYQEALGPKAALADGSIISLRAHSSHKLGSNTASLRVEQYFHATFSASKTLDQILDQYAAPLANMITLLVDVPSALVSLRLTPRSRRPAMLLDPYEVGLKIQPSIDGGHSIAYLATQIVPFDEFDFEKQLPQWFDYSSKLGGIHGLIFGLRYSPDMSTHNRYLNAATAVEGFHRATFPSKRAKVSLKTAAAKAWLETYPEDERNLIKARFSQYINDPSLGDRLSELIEKAGAAFSWIVPDAGKWMTLVKNTRNNLTHQGEMSRVSVGAARMLVLAESVALLASICFLVDLGFSAGDLKIKLARSLRIRILAQDMQATFPALYSQTIVM